MKHQSYSADASLHPYVLHYSFVEMNEYDEFSHDHKLFALGQQFLVFVLSGTLACQPQHHAPFELPKASVVGPFSSRHTTHATGKVRAVIVHLNTYGSYRLLGLSMDTVVNYYRDLQVIEPITWQQTWQRLAFCTTDEKAVHILNDTLKHTMSLHLKSLKKVDEMVEYIGALKGNIDVITMAKHFKTSRHTIERQFLEVTGLTPHMYSRIFRFNNTMLQFHQLHTPAWRNVLQVCGYPNAALFVKDFYYFGANHAKTPAKKSLPSTQISSRKIHKLAQAMYPPVSQVVFG
ncbi:AraC-like DNA-binding protein [Chitinophaga skermanii]|uniref:AraC-like DNA-binding protein n=1 Tax=Chitinophaga skermanii TaxID=331697 RepID=A0A327QN76_9BACT|nr:DUF6597 domain-containing transcriptional factor [Chitinophaga skermanii]RAJ05102.1 AraC-like DNA-binding protein [Chitinophaga skermanii]